MSEITCPPPVALHRAPLRTPGAARSSAGQARHVHVPACSYEVDTRIGPAGPILVLHLAGEIDLYTLPVLRQALAAVVDRRPGDLVVDLAAVEFCCARGIALLADAATAARTHRTGFAMSGVPPYMDRITTLLWPEQRGVRYRSASAAVAAIRGEQARRPT